MFKYALVFLLGLMAFRQVFAQSGTDTILYAMKNYGQLTTNKDSADFFMFVLPQDPNTGLYKVVEITPNGKPKLITNSKSKSFMLTMEGPTTTFFPNGRHNTEVNCRDGKPEGEALLYYPNGLLYAKVKLNAQNSLYIDNKNDFKNKASFIECRDSTGKILAENGSGKWLIFDDDFKKIVSEGMINNRLPEGDWQGSIGDTGKFVCNYKGGKIISGMGYDKSGKAYHFTDLMVQPQYKGGLVAFNYFIERNLHYPKTDNNNKISGVALISFYIEKDGTIKEIKVLRTPSDSLAQEAVKVIKLTSKSWIPGYQYGMLARIQMTLPINFTSF
jgi:TonB family protein